MPRAALASTDGKFINEHFGRATAFHIVDLTDSDYVFVESREISPCCHDHQHDENDFDKAAALLADCDGVFVSKIGPTAAAYLLSKGVRVFEAPGMIEDVMQKVLSSGILSNEAP